MRFYTKVLGWIGVWAVVVAAYGADAPAPNENGLWRLWTSHTNAVADHATIVADCQTFRTKSPNDPLAVVAQGLEAWHLLKEGKMSDAARLLEPMVGVSGDALQKAGAEIARGWLTRLDRELVRAALTRVYSRDVEFPASLAAIKTIKEITQPPFADRWQQPWSYQTTELPTIAGTQQQHYVLESNRLGANSDLANALAIPYASRITIEPVRIMGDDSTGSAVEFTSPARNSIIQTEGTEVDGITLAFMGKKIIVLSDSDHWRVFPRPGLTAR